MDDHHEDATDRQQDQDGRLVVRPQAGGRHDRGRAQQEEPGDDPDDAVVGVGRHAVLTLGTHQTADHGRLGRLLLRPVDRDRFASLPS